MLQTIKTLTGGRVYPRVCNSIRYKRLEGRNSVDSGCILTSYLEETKRTSLPKINHVISLYWDQKIRQEGYKGNP